jgi:hypothetical protein
MDQHFRLEPESYSGYVQDRGERLGVWAVGIIVIGLAIGVALAFVALGVWLLRAVL